LAGTVRQTLFQAGHDPELPDLTDGGPLVWNDFRQQLVEQIRTEPDHRYYEQWLAAFEALVTDAGLLTREQLERRAAEYRSMERDEVF